MANESRANPNVFPTGVPHAPADVRVFIIHEERSVKEPDFLQALRTHQQGAAKKVVKFLCFRICRSVKRFSTDAYRQRKPRGDVITQAEDPLRVIVIDDLRRGDGNPRVGKHGIHQLANSIRWYQRVVVEDQVEIRVQDRARPDPVVEGDGISSIFTPLYQLCLRKLLFNGSYRIIA